MENHVIEKEIARRNLQGWWLASFTNEERDYILDRCKPYDEEFLENNDQEKLRIINGYYVYSWMEDATNLLQTMEKCFYRNSDWSIRERIHQQMIEEAKKNPKNGPGFFEGRSCFSYEFEVKELKKLDLEAANELENLLLGLIQAAEEGQIYWTGYYKELAILYRKQREFSKEVSILERFVNRKHTRTSWSPYMAERLEKARLLETKHRGEDKNTYLKKRRARMSNAEGQKDRVRNSKSEKMRPYEGLQFSPMEFTEITEEEINDAFKAWDDAMPEYKGLLDAKILRKDLPEHKQE